MDGLRGCLALFPGTVVTLAAIQTASGAAFLAGTALAGAGFGPGMLGAFRTISAEATTGHRASLIAAYFIVSYAAFSIPVVAAGVVTQGHGFAGWARPAGVAVAGVWPSFKVELEVIAAKPPTS